MSFKVAEKPSVKLEIYKELCKGCGICLEKCPIKALTWSTKEVGHYSTPIPEVDDTKCNQCGTCELFCPDCAIKVKEKLKE
ncbi:MAG: 4Fe-4S binding protein [Patescibacteria group bacterium]|nr:4Fe-4S binding protein [Patescibacteria group bacterium]